MARPDPRPRPIPVLLLVLLLAAVAGGCRGSGAGAVAGGSGGSSGGPGTGVVVEVVDGDTLDVRLDGEVERVRLLGIDTPESVDPSRPVECHGPEASALLVTLVPPGTPVRLERDAEARDRYGRLLAYVFRVEDGLFVNLAILEAGEAERMEITPNTAYRAVLEPPAAAARAAGAGLWGACADRPP